MSDPAKEEPQQGGVTCPFASPGPLLSNLVRCASTPLSEEGLRSLLSLNLDDFASLANSYDASDPTSRCDRTSLSRVTLDYDSGLHESQELILSFRDQNFSDKTNKTSDKKGQKFWRNNSKSNLSYPSDSGIDTDLSAEISQDSIHLPQSPAFIHVPKDRDIYDLRKKPAARKILQRGVRFAHIPGSFEGQEKLDFIGLLSEMGMCHILATIWRLLSVEDLARVHQVCSRWRGCLISDKDAGARWKEAKEVYMENVNVNLLHPQQKSRLLKTSPRKALGVVTNLLASPSSEGKRSKEKSPPTNVISPSKLRHRLFAEEASRLGPDEQLKQCPRCTMPCRVTPPKSLGQCTRISCQFAFCIQCLCPAHGTTPCRASTRVTRSKAGVDSKKSRIRLRRL